MSSERAVGALVGLAAGDAVGTTLEFKPPGSFEPISDMVGGGPFRLRAGQWTDDTSMAMCLAESILDTGELHPDDQLRRYSAWRNDGYWSSTGQCFDIGDTTARALSRWERDGSVTDASVDQESAANGSLMRLAPVPIRWWLDPAEAAERSAESSRTTHPADRPVDACRLHGAMIAALIGGAHIDEVLDSGFWTGPELDSEVAAVAKGSWRGKEPPEIRGTGFVVAALEAAIWAVAGADGFSDAVLRAANLGDDADTTAAIAGQLAGAYWGVEGIPPAWRENLAEIDRITAMAAELHDAAVAAGAGTAGDLPEWEHDGLVHAWWAAPNVLAGEYPGDTSSDVSTRKINLLVDRGVRTFVDLTTPDDRLAPYDARLADVAERRGLELARVTHPIPDVGTIEDDGYDAIVATIAESTNQGAVYVHCWGGIGRTGTVIGCILVDQGLTGEQALTRMAALRSRTRKARSRAPESDEQSSVIHRRANR